MLFAGIGALRLLAHVIDLKGEDAQSVYCPSWALRVDGRLELRLYIMKACVEIAVDGLHEVGALLIAAVYAPFESEGGNRVNLWIADEVLQMPLNRVYPILQIEVVLDAALGIGVLDGSIDVVSDMEVANGLLKYRPGFFCECHIGDGFSVIQNTFRVLYGVQSKAFFCSCTSKTAFFFA